MQDHDRPGVQVHETGCDTCDTPAVELHPAAQVMALAPSSPDVHGRPLPSWAIQEPSENITEALQALDTYKKKDPYKG